MHRCLTLLVALPLVSAGPHAWATEPQTTAFLNIFSSTCLKHLNNLDALREKLKQVPALPPEKATRFLTGSPGSAWPVPDKSGFFVLALPSDKAMCAVYARRVPPTEAEMEFARLLSSAPPPLRARLTIDERSTSPRNGPTRRIAYEWDTDKAPRKMLFMLTTASGQDTDIQGLATASLMK